MDLIRHIRARRACMAAPIHLRHVMVANLRFIADTIIASEPLLYSAIDNLPSGFLRSYYREHLAEETGHHAMLLADLAGEGVNQLPDRFAMAMAGTQYYLIRHNHPAALLGYLAALESDPMSLEIVGQLEAIHGAALLRTVRYHAEVDREHGYELAGILDAMPKEHDALIEHSANVTLDWLEAWGEAING